MKSMSIAALALVLLASLAVSCSPASTPQEVAAPPSATAAVTLLPEGPSAPPTSAVATATSSRIEPTQHPAPTNASISRPKPPKAGESAFDFTLADLDGNEIRLSDYQGRRVMLNFWATWCGPCRIEIPHMVALYDEIGEQDFAILAINLRENPQKVRDFAEQQNMRFPVLLDPKGSIGGSYFVRAIPTSIFVDEDGVIEAVHVGTLTEKALRQYVEHLMN